MNLLLFSTDRSDEDHNPFTLALKGDGVDVKFVAVELIRDYGGECVGVPLDDGTVFVSPIPESILPIDVITDSIHEHAREVGQSIYESALDYAALLEYLFLCLLQPRKRWVQMGRCDEYWHAILDHEKVYLAVNAYLLKVAGAAATWHAVKVVPHVPSDTPLAERYTAQLPDMRRHGAQSLSMHFAKASAAGCGACTNLEQAA